MSDEDFLKNKGEDDGGFYESGGDDEPQTVADQVDDDKGTSEEDGGFFESGAPSKTTTNTDGDGAQETDGSNETSSEPLTSDEQLALIYANFKANGSDMAVDNPKDVITLMQKGAGYDAQSQKMAPHRKTIKMLKDNNLLDGDTLDLLIEANAKNPDAISKLIRQSDLDIDDMDLDEETDYTPKSHAIDSETFALDEAIDSIRSSPKFDETMTALSKDWDEKSQQDVVKSPEIVSTINSHMESGIYTQIDSIVKREIALGNIDPSTPYLDAYKSVGNNLEEAGAFEATTTHSDANTNQDEVANQAQGSKAANTIKQAAATTKSSSASTGSSPKDNPLEMSDADFLKKYGGRL